MNTIIIKEMRWVWLFLLGHELELIHTFRTGSPSPIRKGVPCMQSRYKSYNRCNYLFNSLTEAEEVQVVDSDITHNITIDDDVVIDSEVNDPVCRVVATSDGKISPFPVLSSLSPSSKSLLEKIELLYSVQSQKELNNLQYMLPRNADKKLYEAEDTINIPFDQEEKLISILKQSLEDGGFALTDQRDRDLCSALNAGYLLRLSLLPDTKDLDPCIGKEFYPELYNQTAEEEEKGKKEKKNKDKKVTSNNQLLFDGKVLVFRRGYSEETTTGRLLLPKLDYLQASIVQRSSTGLTRKLGGIEKMLEEFVLGVVSSFNNAVQNLYESILQEFREFTINILENFGLSENELVAKVLSLDDDAELQSNNTSDEMKDEDSPQSKTLAPGTRRSRIFRLGRYRTPTSSIIPDSLDLDDALLPFLLCEVDANNTTNSEIEQDIYDEINAGKIQCQYDETLYSLINPTSEVQAPVDAVRLLERVSIQNTVDFSSTIGRRELVKNYFKSSTLVEPAYEEVIVIWRPLQRKKPKPLLPPKWMYEAAKVFDIEDRLPQRKNNTRDDPAEDGPMPLEIKAFYDVPMANIEAVLPKTKLVFRPADAIVFDLVSVVSFLAVAGSLKYDSARLDFIAAITLVFFAVRTFFRYSNKYARYDLLVNKFLTSKLAHRRQGALKWIVSEANSNKALRAMLTRDWLNEEAVIGKIKHGKLEDAMIQQGKTYINEKSCIATTQIDVDVMSALEDLDNLNLVNSQFEPKEELESQEMIQQLWNKGLD